jgi:hypothetical protein
MIGGGEKKTHLGKGWLVASQTGLAVEGGSTGLQLRKKDSPYIFYVPVKSRPPSSQSWSTLLLLI